MVELPFEFQSVIQNIPTNRAISYFGNCVYAVFLYELSDQNDSPKEM